MRIGLMIGPELGRYRHKVASLIADAQAAEQGGFTSIWVPQIPGDFDAFTMITLLGRATERVELGTAVLPIQTRHPIAMAQEAASNQAVCDGRFALGLGVSHHWVVEGQLGLPYEQPAKLLRSYLEVLNAALAGPGKVDVENDAYRVHSPIDVTDHAPPPGPSCGARPGDAAHLPARWRPERSSGWPTSARSASTSSRASRRRPPGGRRRASSPACRSRSAPRTRSTPRATARTACSATPSTRPNYQRLLEQGDAKDVGDILAAGDEAAILERLRLFRDAGVTDLAVRILSVGPRPRRARRIAPPHRGLPRLALPGALSGDGGE